MNGRYPLQWQRQWCAGAAYAGEVSVGRQAGSEAEQAGREVRGHGRRQEAGAEQV